MELLTDRELEVLHLVAKGLSNSEIAGTLFVGEATVKTHVSNLLTKLDIRDRIHVVIFAYENGLVGGAGRSHSQCQTSFHRAQQLISPTLPMPK